MPTDSRKALETLEEKRGLLYTLIDARRIGEKAQETPEQLSDDDLVVLAFYTGEHAASEARIRRAQALAPMADPPLQTKALATGTAPPALRDFALMSAVEERQVVSAIGQLRVHLQEHRRTLARDLLAGGMPEGQVLDALAAADEYYETMVRETRPKILAWLRQT